MKEQKLRSRNAVFGPHHAHHKKMPKTEDKRKKNSTKEKRKKGPARFFSCSLNKQFGAEILAPKSWSATAYEPTPRRPTRAQTHTARRL